MKQTSHKIQIGSFLIIGTLLVVFQFVCLGRNLQFKDHPNLRFIF